MNGRHKTAAMLLTAACVLGAAGSAQASTYKVNVPFDFVVHGTTLPAGQYRLDDDGGIVIIRNEHNRKVGMVIMTTPAGGRDPAGNEPSLTFTHGEKGYKLSDIWESTWEGRQVGK